MARPDWLAKVRSSSGISSPKRPRSAAGSTSARPAGRWRTIGTASSERQPSAESSVQVRVPGHLPRGRGPRASCVRRPPGRRGDETRRMCSARSRSVSAGSPPAVARTRKQSSSRVVLHDRAAVGAGEPYGAADDAAQHLVGVQAGADRVADLPQHLELVHLAASSLLAGLEGLRSARPAAATIAACAANALQQARLARARTGRPGCATPTARPTTSPPSSIGADIRVR